MHLILKMPRCTKETLTDAQPDRAERLINCIMKEWRALRLSMGKPKIHALGDHLLAAMRFSEVSLNTLKISLSLVINWWGEMQKEQVAWEVERSHRMPFPRRKRWNLVKVPLMPMTYLSLPALKSIEQTNNKENEKQVKKERCDLAFEEAWQNYEQEPILVTDWFI